MRLCGENNSYLNRIKINKKILHQPNELFQNLHRFPKFQTINANLIGITTFICSIEVVDLR